MALITLFMSANLDCCCFFFQQLRDAFEEEMERQQERERTDLRKEKHLLQVRMRCICFLLAGFSLRGHCH